MLKSDGYYHRRSVLNCAVEIALEKCHDINLLSTDAFFYRVR